MAITLPQKEAILKHLETDVVNQKAILILSADKAEASLTSKLNFKLRSEARKQGVALKVVKNTLIKKTFPTLPDLVGPTYLAYLVNSEQSDEIKVPKAMVDLLTKDFKENLSILGAVVNGEFLGSTQAIALSKTPSFQDSMSMLAGSLSQAISKIAISVNEVPASLARSISQYSETLS